MTKRTALVVCPGRGTYNKEELGYLARYHDASAGMIAAFDSERAANEQEKLSRLDGAGRYSIATHTRGDNASALIYACSLLDFLAIDRERFDIVAVTGNSMGWYTALACAGSLDPMAGFKLVNTMGTLMQETLAGGQVIYPFVDDNWIEIPGKREELIGLTATIPNLFVSIELGGMVVFAGDDIALEELTARLEPVQGRFPLQLANHAGFHSPLQIPVSRQARERLPASQFGTPSVPLIDGRGHCWLPFATETEALWNYTLGQQVVETYDFTAAVKNSMREFAPDIVIVLGPGTTMGGAVAQSLISARWFGLTDKPSFIDRQKSDPVLFSMGIDEQRIQVAG